MLVAEEVARGAGKKLEFGDWDGDQDGKLWCRKMRQLLLGLDSTAAVEWDSDDEIEEEDSQQPAATLAPSEPTVVNPRSNHNIKVERVHDSDDDSLSGYASSDASSLACRPFTRPLSAGTLPWLTHLSLNIALSLPNCYFLMSELSHTLQNVSFTKIGSLPRSQPQDCILTPSPTLRHRDAIALPHLAALSVHSQVDIQSLLELCSSPLLRKVELYALADDITQNTEAEALKISAKLALPWDILIDLSLKNEDPRWRPAIGQILSQCDMLERFEWKGHHGVHSRRR